MAQTKHSASSIPLFYRLFFTWLDPIICIWGASMDFFDPDLVLSSHIPNPTVDIASAMVLKQRGGAMLNFGFISAFLLRHTYDVKAWSIVQMADFLVDVTVLWGGYDALKAQGRLDPKVWRWEDWGAVGITVVAGLVRLAFLARIGFKRGSKTTKRS